MPPAGFEPATTTSDRPQSLALDRSVTGIGIRSPDRPVRGESLYLLSYPGPETKVIQNVREAVITNLYKTCKTWLENV